VASVTPRKNKNGTVTWRVNFRIGEKQCQDNFDNEKGAYQFAALVEKVGGETARSVRQQRSGRPADMPTLREFTEKYLDLDSGLLTGIEPGTRAGYVRNAERSFLQVLGDYPLDVITKADVGKWVAWQEAQPSQQRKGQPVSSKTVHNYHALLSSVLSCAVDEQIITHNPAYKTRLSKGVKHEGVFLSRDEFGTLLHFVDERYKRFLLFLAGTGCRWGEATAVTWGDINYDVRPVTVRIDKAWKKAASGAPVLKHPKTSRATRTISLWPELVEALGTPGDSNQLVFGSPETGTHLWPGRFRSSIWLPAVEKAMDKKLCAEEGLKPILRRPTVHDLRHTHASWLVASGAPLPFVQARMGHESITTTIGVYGHLLPDAHIQMADMMAETMSTVLPIRGEIEG
jgi:integrase